MPVTPSEVKQTMSRHVLTKYYTTLSFYVCMINEIIPFKRIKNEHSYPYPGFLCPFLSCPSAMQGKERKEKKERKRKKEKGVYYTIHTHA